jgi:hypothetical protein
MKDDALGGRVLSGQWGVSSWRCALLRAQGWSWDKR